jgi:organic hydroperoxide reductase OsmC/OhrA
VATDTIHRYRTSAAWRGSTGVGYEGYDRQHAVQAEPSGVELDLSSDAAFRGDPGRLNPEVLLVAAASSCQLLSFLAVAARARIDVVEYRDDAEGEMPDADQRMWVDRILLRPRITVRGDVDEARLAHLVEVAHRECFIASSLRTEVVVEPAFTRA